MKIKCDDSGDLNGLILHTLLAKINYSLEIYVNGLRQDYVIAVDTTENAVLRHKTHDDGSFVEANEQIVTEVVIGKIEVRVEPSREHPLKGA